MTAVACTISTETRCAPRTPQGARKLVESLVAAEIFPHSHEARFVLPERRRWREHWAGFLRRATFF
jgi:hypothetical protein